MPAYFGIKHYATSVKLYAIGNFIDDFGNKIGGFGKLIGCSGNKIDDYGKLIGDNGNKIGDSGKKLGGFYCDFAQLEKNFMTLEI